MDDLKYCVYILYSLKDNKLYIGFTTDIKRRIAEHISGPDLAKSLSKVFSQEIICNSVPPDVFRSFGFQGADDMGNMFKFKRDFNEDYCNARNVDQSKTLNPGLLNFETWLEHTKEKIPFNYKFVLSRIIPAFLFKILKS